MSRQLNHRTGKKRHLHLLDSGSNLSTGRVQLRRRNREAGQLAKRLRSTTKDLGFARGKLAHRG